jgi:Xaa-Pro aminopeptidase
MEYSPRGEIPWVSRVDGGTLELVRQTGTRVVSSADLIQWYEARWSAESLEWHLRAAEGLSQIKDLAFETVRSRVTQGQSLNEYGVQQEMVRQLAERRLVSDCPPIVAVNRRTADPHYLPTARESQPIHKGDLLLLDMWAKCDAPGAVYADITWVAFLGKRPPDRYQAVFQTVRTARDRGVEFVREASQKGTPPCGFEVDDAVRRVIEDAGYGPYFLHRTGHSLGVDVHGAGVNLDHLETCDTRRLIPGVAFSVEPGIYLEDFGIRSEINVFMAESGPRVTTLPVQDKLVCLA